MFHKARHLNRRTIRNKQSNFDIPPVVRKIENMFDDREVGPSPHREIEFGVSEIQTFSLRPILIWISNPFSDRLFLLILLNRLIQLNRLNRLIQ